MGKRTDRIGTAAHRFDCRGNRSYANAPGSASTESPIYQGNALNQTLRQPIVGS
jgi:hypothetical protein